MRSLPTNLRSPSPSLSVHPPAWGRGWAQHLAGSQPAAFFSSHGPLMTSFCRLDSTRIHAVYTRMKGGGVRQQPLPSRSLFFAAGGLVTPVQGGSSSTKVPLPTGIKERDAVGPDKGVPHPAHCPAGSCDPQWHSHGDSLSHFRCPCPPLPSPHRRPSNLSCGSAPQRPPGFLLGPPPPAPADRDGPRLHRFRHPRRRANTVITSLQFMDFPAKNESWSSSVVKKYYFSGL